MFDDVTTYTSPPSKKSYFAWLLYLTIMIIFFSIVLPRKGFDFTDNGYYLYNALSIGKFHVLANLSIGGALINAILIKIGINRYLTLEYSYNIFAAISVISFWSVFDKYFWRSIFLPLCLLTILSCNIMNFASYQTTPAISLLLGLALLFHGLKSKNVAIKVLLLNFSIVIITLSAFGNISLIPSIPIIIALLLPLFKGEKTMFANYTLTFLIVIGIALYIINPFSNSSLHSIAIHTHGISKSIKNIFSLLLYWIKNLMPALFLSLVTIFEKYLFLKKTSINKFLQKNQFKPDWSLFLILFFIWFNLFNMHILGRLIPIIYSGQSTSFDIFNYGMLLFYSALSILVISPKINDYDYRLLITLIIGIIFSIGLSSTTSSYWGRPYSGFDSHTILSAPIYVSFFFLYFQKKINILSKDLAGLLGKYITLTTIISLMVIGIITNFLFVYRDFPLFSSKIKIISGQLTSGIFTKKQKTSMLLAINKLYIKYNCKNKTFVAFPSLPLLYYLYEKKAILNQPWLSYYMNESNIDTYLINYLRFKNNWCVIYAPRYNYEPKNNFLEFNNFLSTVSTKIIHLQFPLQDKNKITDYHSAYPRTIIFYTR